MDNQYDAVVVGAGPAGSTTAAGIANRGFRVLLLEEHSDIGLPLHCSGLVTPRTLEEAGVGDELILNRVVGAHIHAPSGRQLTLGGNGTRALVIDRIALDRVLAEKAQEQGVELTMGSKVVNVERKAHGVRIHINRQGKSITVSTRLLVGADGAHSRVARALDMRGRNELVSGLGIEGILPGVDRNNVQVFVGKSLAPGWFAWVIPIGDGDRVRLGVGTPNGMKPIDCLHRILQFYAKELRGWQPIRWTGGTIPLWAKRKVVQDNVLLVGDAAGQVKPTSGGGIYPCLVGARVASEVAVTGLTRDDLSEKTLEVYPRTWESIFAKEFQQGQDLRHVYTSLDDRDFDKLLRIFGYKGLLKLINQYGDIDFPGGMFQRLTKITPALWFFVRGPLRHAPLWK